MDSDTDDRRVRRSKRDLAAALLELTAERPYASIQVHDITERADVGYATFYRHYASKDDLMLSIFDEITSELEDAASESGTVFFREEGRLLFTHVQKYEGFYRSLLANPDLARQLKKLLAQRIIRHMRGEAVPADRAAFPIDLAANHIVAALIGLIEWWLEKDQQPTIEAMAGIYERLIIQATWYALDGRNLLSIPGHHSSA